MDGVVKNSKKKLAYRRILLKLSGEVLRNRETGDSIDASRLAFMAERVKKIHALGVEVGIVLGGGNIFRGLAGAKNGVTLQARRTASTAWWATRWECSRRSSTDSR